MKQETPPRAVQVLDALVQRSTGFLCASWDRRPPGRAVMDATTEQRAALADLTGEMTFRHFSIYTLHADRSHAGRSYYQEYTAKFDRDTLRIDARGLRKKYGDFL